jgi:hypothetical protein
MGSLLVSGACGSDSWSTRNTDRRRSAVGLRHGGGSAGWRGKGGGRGRSSAWRGRARIARGSCLVSAARGSGFWSARWTDWRGEVAPQKVKGEHTASELEARGQGRQDHRSTGTCNPRTKHPYEAAVAEAQKKVDKTTSGHGLSTRVVMETASELEARDQGRQDHRSTGTCNPRTKHPYEAAVAEAQKKVDKTASGHGLSTRVDMDTASGLEARGQGRQDHRSTGTCNPRTKHTYEAAVAEAQKKVDKTASGHGLSTRTA